MFARHAIKAVSRPLGCQLGLRAFSGHGPPPTPEGFYSQHWDPVATRPIDNVRQLEFMANIELVRTQIAAGLDGTKRKYPSIWIHSILGLIFGFIAANLWTTKSEDMLMLWEKWDLLGKDEKDAIAQENLENLAAYYRKYPFMVIQRNEEQQAKLDDRRLALKPAELYLGLAEEEDDDDDF